MKYYVVKLLTNTAGEDASSVTPYSSEKDARVGRCTVCHCADSQ